MANQTIKIVRANVGKVVNSGLTRQPIISNQGSGLNSGNQPATNTVPAVTNPYQRAK